MRNYFEALAPESYRARRALREGRAVASLAITSHLLECVDVLRQLSYNFV